jgi:hypothetical protein
MMTLLRWSLPVFFLVFAGVAHAQTRPSVGRDADTIAYVRLIFIANCFSPAENSAFKFAAANLVADYERDSLDGGRVVADVSAMAGRRMIIKRIYFDNARQIVDSINHQRLAIKSVDFLSHSRDDRIGATMTRGKLQYRTSLFESRERMSEARVLYEAEGGDLRNGSHMASIEQIRFSRFCRDAVIEIHGCHAGVNVDSMSGNICRRLSLALYRAGKRKAVVIGHGTRANPNPRTAASMHAGVAAAPGPGFKESVLGQDYRHGLRMVYYNGRIVLSTTTPGAIPRAAITSAIGQGRAQ